MIRKKAEAVEEQGGYVDETEPAQGPNEGLTGDAFIAANKTMARRRRITLLMVMTQYLHIHHKAQGESGGLSEE